MKRIMIEAETSGEFRSMFSLRIHEKIAGNNITLAQAHVLVDEILDRISVPRPAGSGVKGWDADEGSLT